MKKYFKEYDYDRWTWLRIFPQYRQMEKEYNEMGNKLIEYEILITRLSNKLDKKNETIIELNEEIDNLKFKVEKYKKKKN